MTKRDPWWVEGPDRRPESSGLEQALRMAHADESKQRPPTEADAPPLSTFPVTRAARAALRYARGWKDLGT